MGKLSHCLPVKTDSGNSNQHHFHDSSVMFVLLFQIWTTGGSGRTKGFESSKGGNSQLQNRFAISKMPYFSVIALQLEKKRLEDVFLGCNFRRVLQSKVNSLVRPIRQFFIKKAALWYGFSCYKPNPFGTRVTDLISTEHHFLFPEVLTIRSERFLTHKNIEANMQP